MIWLSITVLMVLVFCGATYINYNISKSYLEEQLLVKNIDNANALSALLSNAKGDDALIEITLQATFDLGHYQEISFIKPDGTTLVNLHGRLNSNNSNYQTKIPAWFTKIVNIVSRPGVAVLTKGWRQLGQLTIVSSNNDANLSLWKSFKETAIWFLLSFTLFTMISYYFFKGLTKILQSVVLQAIAISEHRLELNLEPKILEFKHLVKAMNNSTKQVIKMLTQDTQRIEFLRNKTQLDQLTGLINREYFIATLELEMQLNNALHQGFMIFIRLEGLIKINHDQGWESSDKVIVALANILKTIAKKEKKMLLAKVWAGSFTLVIPSWIKPQDLENTIREAWKTQPDQNINDQAISLQIGFSKLMADQAVMPLIENARTNALSFGDTWIAANSLPETETYNIKEWRNLIANALQDRRLSYNLYPVIGANLNPLHYEATVHFKNELGDHLFNAGSFVPWAIRTKQMVLIDMEVTKLAMAQIVQDKISIAVNLNIESLSDPRFLAALDALIQSNASFAKYLNLEVPARFIFNQIEVFSRFCAYVIPQGVKVGIDNLGLETSDFALIKNLGLHYIKVHPALIYHFTADTHQENGENNIALLANLLLISRSMGFMLIANGVTSTEVIQKLIDFGFDGVTGPAVGIDKTYLPLLSVLTIT